MLINKLKSVVAITLVSCASMAYAAIEDDLYYNAMKEVHLDIAFSPATPMTTISKSFRILDVLEPDIIFELQKSLGFKINEDGVIITDFGDLMALIDANAVQVAAGTISNTKERQEKYDMSYPVIQSGAAIVINKNNKDNIKSLSDLHGKTIVVQAGTTFADFFKKANLNVKEITQITPFMCFYLVSKGLADAIIFDLPTATFYADTWENGNLMITGEVFNISEESQVAFAIPKNLNELRPSIKLYMKWNKMAL